MALKENYKDDILDTSQNVKRKYQMENNGDGTVSFTDVTEYTQQGDSFGASDLNAMAHAINNTSSDAEHTSYDNTESGLISDNVQGAIDEINDNLSGFKFYPIGTQLVALVSNNSYYTDANGNYIIADSTTGQSMIDNVTYKALASVEDLRGKVGADTCSPFSKDDFVHISGKFTLGDTSGLQRFTGTLNLNSNKYNGFQIDLFTFSVGSGSATSVSLVSATITNGVLTMSVNANASSGSYINFNLVMCSANTRNKITNVSIVGRR